MLRTLQAIDWGILPPYPLAIHPRVTSMIGQNGSGKSSAQDAIKAALGCNRFGQGRGCASYLNSGRGSHPPAREAFVLLCCTFSQPRPDLTFANPRGEFTLLLWVTRTRRLHLALPGHLVLGVGETPLHQDLEQLKERYPRKQWLRPEDFQSRVLDPLGATAGVQRLLEIPQGETQRLLDARPDRLLRNLLALMGALEPLEQLAARRAEYQEAQAERERARRAVLEEELALARARSEHADDGRLLSTEEQLREVQARARGAVQAANGELDAQESEAQQRQSGLDLELSQAREQLSEARARQRAAAAAPEDFKHASRAAKQLADAGVRAEVIAAELDARWASPAQVSALRHLLCCVAVHSDDWDSMTDLIDQHPHVQFVKAQPGRKDGLAAGWWRSQITDQALHEHDTHVEVADTAFVPRLDVQLPLEPEADDLVETARTRVWEAEHALEELARDLQRLEQRRHELDRAQRTLQDGPAGDAQADELPGLLAERRRLSALVSDLQAAHERQQERRRLLDRQQERLDDANEYLDGQEGALEQAKAALDDARAFYQRQVSTLISSLDRHFRELCDAASMRGELELVEDALAEAGGRLNIRVAESPVAPLRSYAEADLSGGWRAKTSVLMLMAALCAAGGDHVLPVACLDEHSAALDEERIAELGWVFQRLARERGLQIVLAVPTKRSSEQAAWSDQQIGFLKASPDAVYAPLPHILEATDEATVPPPVS